MAGQACRQAEGALPCPPPGCRPDTPCAGGPVSTFPPCPPHGKGTAVAAEMAVLPRAGHLRRSRRPRTSSEAGSWGARSSSGRGGVATQSWAPLRERKKCHLLIPGPIRESPIQPVNKHWRKSQDWAGQSNQQGCPWGEYSLEQGNLGTICSTLQFPFFAINCCPYNQPEQNTC